MIQEISPKQFIENLSQSSESENWELIDVRETWEYELINYPGSRNFPLSKIMEDPHEIIKKIDWNKKVVFICRTGGRSYQSAQFFMSEGPEIYNLESGIYGLNMVKTNALEVSGSEEEMQKYLA
jgi:rhodanese-related sulfurtransferase